jgi:hypothetical protein
MSDDYDFEIITSDDVPDERGILSHAAPKKISVPSDVLVKGFGLFFKNLDKVLKEIPDPIGNGFSAEEMELSFSIGATGSIELIAKAGVDVKGAITIKLKRK